MDGIWSATGGRAEHSLQPNITNATSDHQRQVKFGSSKRSMEHLLIAGIVQALFTSAFLFSLRRGALADKVLAVWMVFIALPMIGGTAVRLWPDVHIPILSADLIYPLTYGPFIWMYVRAVTGSLERLDIRELIHFVPFAVMSTLQLATGWAPPPPHPNILQFETGVRIVGGLNLTLMLGYSVAVFWRLAQHRREVVQHFSRLSNRVTLTWFYWLTFAICAVFFMLFLASTFSLPDLLKIHLPAQIVIILAMSFFGLRLRTRNQNVTVAARTIADRNTLGQRS